MRTNALPSSARKNSCVLHDVRPGAFDVRKRASHRCVSCVLALIEVIFFSSDELLPLYMAWNASQPVLYKT